MIRFVQILWLIITCGCASQSGGRAASLEAPTQEQDSRSRSVEPSIRESGTDTKTETDTDVDETHPASACPKGAAWVTRYDGDSLHYATCRRPDEVEHGPWIRIWKIGDRWVERGVMENGKKHGPYSKHRGDGSLMVEGAYVQDEPHGLWSSAYADGKKSESITYDHGLREGPLQRWHENGTHSEEATYRKDRLHGEYRKWYASGRLLTSGSFVDGRPEGTFQTWSETGNPIGVTVVWRQGRVVSVKKEAKQ